MPKTSTYRDYCYCGTVLSIYDDMHGMNLNHVERIFQSIHYALDQSKNVLVVRFDLHCVVGTDSNAWISQLRDLLFKRIERDIDSRARTYIKAKKHKNLIWAREQASEGPHYHCALILDGQLFNSPKRILTWVKELWGNITSSHGHVPAIKRPYYKLHYSDIQQRQRVIYRLTYLAKRKGKQSSRSIRHFGCANVRPLNLDTWNPEHQRVNKSNHKLNDDTGSVKQPVKTVQRIKVAPLYSASLCNKLLDIRQLRELTLQRIYRFQVFEPHEPNDIAHITPKIRSP